MELTLETDVSKMDSNYEGVKNDFKNSGFVQMSHLSKMAAVDIEFNDLMYSVPGFQKGNSL